MKQTQILSGKFSSGDKAKGNFTGYNASGERIFIFKEQMATLGFTKDSEIKFPFFAIVDTKEIATRDEDGNLTTTMAKRVQATNVFKTAAEIISAVNSDKLLALEAAAALKTAATAVGLNEAAVKSLLELA